MERTETMKTKRLVMLIGAICSLLFTALPSWAFYSPTTGRWLNRDPIEEQGGNNLYAFVNGDPIALIDYLGTATGDDSENGDDTEYGFDRIGLIEWMRDSVDNFNNLQQFAADVMATSEGDDSDFVVALLGMANQRFASDLGNTGAKWNIHHVMPKAKEFAAYFRRAEINIEDFRVRITQRFHIGLHGLDVRRGRGERWNADWRDFFRGNPEANAGEITDFAGQMLERYGLQNVKYLPKMGL
jgi:hypothetical protein